MVILWGGLNADLADGIITPEAFNEAIAAFNEIQNEGTASVENGKLTWTPSE